MLAEVHFHCPTFIGAKKKKTLWIQSALGCTSQEPEEAGILNLYLRQADAENIIFEEESFDSILCSSAMIYLQHIDVALQRFLSWLKPGGKLCFNTPQVNLQYSATYYIVQQHLHHCIVQPSLHIVTIMIMDFRLQEPCVPATAIFYSILAEKVGLQLMQLHRLLPRK
jgi:2-polyprenyl-3-methyl-5-hydroxy-6-metoxy-1,4-benzoquinol methylase